MIRVIFIDPRGRTISAGQSCADLDLKDRDRLVAVRRDPLTGVPDVSVPSMKDSIGEDMLQMFKSRQHCDVKFIAGGKSHEAHRFVISARSSLFSFT